MVAPQLGNSCCFATRKGRGVSSAYVAEDNQAVMTMAIAKGLDGAIINPLDHKMMVTVIA